MTTSDHEWPRVITSDHEWPRVTTSDHEWPRVTASYHEWPRVRFNQNVSVLLLWRHYGVIFTIVHQITTYSRKLKLFTVWTRSGWFEISSKKKSDNFYWLWKTCVSSLYFPLPPLPPPYPPSLSLSLFEMFKNLQCGLYIADCMWNERKPKILKISLKQNDYKNSHKYHMTVLFGSVAMKPRRVYKVRDRMAQKTTSLVRNRLYPSILA